MRSLNLDQLRALVAVAEGRSFSAAARRLNLSQPAVSVQIRELERRYGVALIERLGKQAHPTPPGRALIEAAGRIFEACDEAEAAMRRYHSGWIGRVRIGTTNTGLMYLLPPVLRRLGREHRGIDLHVTNLPTRESVEAILRNAIDLALVTLPVESPQIRVIPLLTERMVAIFPADRTDLPDEVEPEFVQGQPLLLEHTRAALHDLTLLWLAEYNANLRVNMHLGTVEALKSAVAAGLGMSIVPEIAIRPTDTELVMRPLRPALSRTIGLIEHRSKPDEPALAIVRKALLAALVREPDLTGSRRSGAAQSGSPK